MQKELDLPTLQRQKIVARFNQFELESVPEHYIEQCFKSSNNPRVRIRRKRPWVYLDRYKHFKWWEARKFEAHQGGTYNTHILAESASIRDLAMLVLGVTDESVSDFILQRRLKKEGHVVAIKQIDNEFKRLEYGVVNSLLSQDEGKKSTYWFVDNKFKIHGHSPVLVISTFLRSYSNLADQENFNYWPIFLGSFSDGNGRGDAVKKVEPGSLVVSRNLGCFNKI